MLVGIFENQKSTWTFKVTGPPSKLTNQEKAIADFFDQVDFDDGQAVWDLPEGWSKGPDKMARFATLMIDAQPPAVEMSIMKLPGGQDLLLNANRWLGQLELPEVTQDTLETCLKEIKSEKQSYHLFDATGTGSGSMRPPFAGMGNRRPTPSPLQTAPTPKPPFTFDAPDGWEEGKSSGMVPVRLSKQKDDDRVEITIVKLFAATNDWESNVQRWAGQVQMEMTPEEMEEATETVTLDGTEGQLIRLFSKSNPTAIIGGMVKRDQTAWFLKLSGTKTLVEQESDTFLKLIESIKF